MIFNILSFILQQFDRFIAFIKNQGTAAARAITHSREKIKSNIDWLKHHRKLLKPGYKLMPKTLRHHYAECHCERLPCIDKETF